MGFDCVVIPGAVKMTTPFASVPNQICGGKSVGLVTAAGKTGKTICSKFSLLFCCRDVVYYRGSQPFVNHVPPNKQKKFAYHLIFFQLTM